MNTSLRPKSAKQLKKREDESLQKASMSTNTSTKHLSTQQMYEKLRNFIKNAEWALLETWLRQLENGVDLKINEVDPESGLTPLVWTVKEGRLQISENLIELGAELNQSMHNGKTALHYAVQTGKEELVRSLLRRNADSSIATKKFQLPLHLACGKENVPTAIVEMLLRTSARDARIFKDHQGLLPLHYAINSGNYHVCKELLESHISEQLSAKVHANRDTSLHLACRKKNLDIIRLLIENGSEINETNLDGHTPLHISSYEGDEDAVKYLFICKANASITDDLDRTALHMATERGQNKVIEILIDKFKCNYSLRTKDGSTLMHIASESGHQSTALLLLKKGVPLHMPNKAGAICLHSACKKGHVEVVTSLLQKGAQIDARTKDNYTPLHVAVENGKYLVVQMLLGYGADVQIKGGVLRETPLHIAAKIPNSEKCAEMLLKSGANPDEHDENGETPLHIACRHGQFHLAKLLLSDKASSSAQSKSGETSLHVAVRFIQFEMAKEILEHVEANSSRLDAVMLVNTANFEGETVVHYACEISKTMLKREFEDTDLMRLLLKYGGDINYHAKWTQETALHYCAASGNINVLSEIIRKFEVDKLQSIINQQSKNGSSPLLVAAEKGNADIIKVLLTCHARTDIFDENGKSALHLASEYGQLNVVNLLLDRKAFINAKAKNGFTALHLACQNGHSELVRVLIDRGADVDGLTLTRKNSIHLAAQYGQLSVCSLLTKLESQNLLNAVDNKGQTAIHLAAENDHVRIIKLFLRSKTRLDLLDLYDQAGNTCAHIAASKGSVEVLKELVKFSKTSVIASRNKTNQSSCLHLATAGGYEDAVKLLLECGANPIEENQDGMTPINLAAKVGNSKILNGLKKFMTLNSSSKMTGLTALHIAAFYGQADFCREMLEQIPANMPSEAPNEIQTLGELKLEAGLTPLHLAAFSGHESVIRLLLNSANVEVEAATSKSDSISLHFAAENGHIIAVGLLLSKLTSQLHTKNRLGRTAIHLAATQGHTEMISVLIGQGANINVTDKTGWTALHYASLKGHLNVVKLLVESGTTTVCETNDGKIPLCYAAANGHNDVLDYLLTRRFDTYSLMQDTRFLVDLVECGKVNENASLKKFILLSPAPVDSAAKLSSIYLALSEKEKSIAKDLIKASKFCENLANELVTIVAAFKSIQSLLKANDNQGRPFIDVLIDCEQKEVLSNFVIQQSFSDIWDSNLKLSSATMCGIFLLFLLVPPIWLLFSLPIPVRSRRDGLVISRIPIIKFLCFLVSHIYLIVLLYLTCVQPLRPISSMSDSLPTYHEWLLLAWFSGLLVAELSQPSDKGGLGFLKIICIIAGTLGWVLHVITFGLEGNDQTRYELFYGRNILFGFVILMSCVQLLDFLSFHSSFGPWAIIFREILKDVFIFVGIFILVLLGFTCLFTSVYQDVYPDPENKADPSWKDPRSQGLSILASLEFMFFSIFGITDPADWPTLSRSPIQAIAIEKTVYCVYMLSTMTILLNLLVAMMSTTYQRIQEQSDIEWKFGRAKLIRNMAKTSSNPPAPLNIFTKLIQVLIGLVTLRARINADLVSFIDGDELSEQDEGDKSQLRQKRESKESNNAFSSKTNALNNKIDTIVDWKKMIKQYLKTKSTTNELNKDEFEGDENE